MNVAYVVKSLEASLWAFYDNQSFEEECLMAVNLGNDSNTYWFLFMDKITGTLRRKWNS